MAQGTLFFLPIQRSWTNTGSTSNGSLLFFYAAGTTTPVTVYQDVGLSVPFSSPITADLNGIFPEIFLTPGTAYKVDLQTTGGVSLTGYPADNQLAIPGSAATVDSIETAGESLSAGQGAYLSDGSGGKNAGQIYKWDASNAYSATLPIIGMVPNGIAAGASGTFRQGGQITGLSVTPGLDYFVGTSGALTSTAPSLARFVGRADSATSLLVAGNPPPNFPNLALTSPTLTTPTIISPTVKSSILTPSAAPLGHGICHGRLTLTSGSPVTSADVTGAATIYFSPYLGGTIGLYDGSTNWTILPFVETSLALGTLSNATPYDVFAFNNTGALALELSAWTNSTTRATALVLQNGIWVKNGALTRRYLGTFVTTSTTQTEDSVLRRYLWNYYNRVPRLLQRFEGASTWNYTTATIRQANGSGSNQVQAVIGVAEVPISLLVTVNAYSVTSAAQVQIGIGADVTNAFSAGNVGGTASVTSGGSATALPLVATYQAVPAIGAHTYAWCEWSQATGNTTTWNSAPAATSPNPWGIQGWVEG